LTAAAKKIDELADDISRTVLPDGLARAAKPRVAQASGDDVERAAKAVMAAETKLADFNNMTPEELVAAANDASHKAATLAGVAEARAGAVPNASVKALLDEAARDVERLNDEQHAAVDAHMRDPADRQKAAALADVGRRLNDRAQRLLDELLPEASKQRNNGPHSVRARSSENVCPSISCLALLYTYRVMLLRKTLSAKAELRKLPASV
jgi:hypothetical protein